jgi:hypothetical protein
MAALDFVARGRVVDLLLEYGGDPHALIQGGNRTEKTRDSVIAIAKAQAKVYERVYRVLKM